VNRVGTGFDVHRLVNNRPLVIGGVTIDYHLGLDGHSDADVLVHALIDALLGAAGLRDIGFYFPPDDNRYKNINSLELLAVVKAKLEESNWCLVNADTVIIVEAPKLSAYIEEMRDNLAAVLGVTKSRVAVKATTTEGLGFCGRGEGVAAQAVVLLEKSSQPCHLLEVGG
jgi:2-C-methyl-D-erythritol 2,4-cyclodiphosphate synthase